MVAAVECLIAEVTEVDLRLLTRLGLEAHGGTRLPRATSGMDVVLQDGDTSTIPLVLQLAQQDGAVLHAIGQALLEIRLVRIELGGAWRPCPLRRDLFRSKIGAHGVATDSQVLGDRADRPALAGQFVDLFHQSTSQHVGAYLLAYPRGQEAPASWGGS